MIQNIYSPTALGQVNGIPMQENAYVGQRCAIRLALRPQPIYTQDTFRYLSASNLRTDAHKDYCDG